MNDRTKVRHWVARLAALLMLFGLAGKGLATTITEVQVPGTVGPGEPVDVLVTVQSTADAVENTELTVELYQSGSLISSRSQSVQINPHGDNGPGITYLSMSLNPDDYQEEGTYMVKAILTGTDVINPIYPSDPPTRNNFEIARVAYFDVAGVPITVSPKNLTLSGKAGETATTTFVITSGKGPFSLVSANDEGRGSFSNDNPGIGETVTYGFRIPSSATDQDSFTDFITITAADGTQVTIRADITVSGGGGGGDIGDALDDIAQTPPQKAVADTIATVCPSGAAEPQLQEDCNQLVGAAMGDPESAKAASRALAQVTADQASAPVDAAHTSIYGQSRNVGTRLAALRGGAMGVSMRGLAMSINGKTLPVGRMAQALLDELAGAKGGAAGSDSIFDTTRLGVFVNGSFSGGSKDRTINEAGFDFDAISLTLGLDYRFKDNLVGGIALGYDSNDTDLENDGGYLDTRGYSLSLYGSWFEPSGLYLDGLISWGWNDYDQARAIRYQLGNVKVDQKAKASFDGTQWSASIGGGYSMNKGAWSFGPTARLEYIHASVDSFDEHMSQPNAPGGGWAVHVDDQEMDSFTSQIGAEVSYVTSQSWGVLIPSASIEWVHEFKDNPGDVRGYFLQDTSRTWFSLPTDDYDNDYFHIGLGASAQFANGISGFIQYRQLFGYSDLDAWSLNLGVRMEL